MRVTGHRWPLAGIVLVALLGLSLAGAAATPAPRSTGPLRMLMVGDSMAESLANGFEGSVGQQYGLDVDNQGTPNCSLAMGDFQVEDFPPRESAPPCQPGSGDPGWPTDWSSLVAQDHPDVSVFLARLDVMDRLFNGQWTHIGDPAYDSYLLGQMQIAVQVLSSQGGKVVFLTSPYYSSGTQPDGQPWPEDDPARVNLYNSMLRQVANQHPGVVYVIDLNRIADPDGHFQANIDGVPVRFTDGVHWTYYGDWWLAPRILPQIYQVAAGHGGLVTDATTLATATTPSDPNYQPFVAMDASPDAKGYDVTTRNGVVVNYGDSPAPGSLADSQLSYPIVGMARTTSGAGYWLVAADGGVFTEGDAGFFGSAGAIALAQPVVGMAATPDNHGYWLVAADGGIFTYGDAPFFGSTGAMVLNQPIVGMASTPNGQGYWLVASDGGIFSFGDARFFGSTGAMVLNQPIVGMTRTPKAEGYWLVAADGGIFSFGDARFFGSTGALTLAQPIVDMTSTVTGQGYWLVAADGGIFSFGDAQFLGSPA